ncbi:unnamed protein product [Auanema sp. JU1783]|nr:unnamed protein product [Auanema sp. JU1783]
MQEVENSSVEVKPCFKTNPDIFRLGERKEHVLAHEIGAGSRCRKCDCSGLDLHFWRKICKTCGCRMDEHDVQLPNEFDHGQIIIGRLFGVREHFESTSKPLIALKSSEHDKNAISSSATSPIAKKNVTAVYNFKTNLDEERNDVKSTEYSWAPVPDKLLVEKYMMALPEIERPILGTGGEQNRKSRLQFQLPLYDCNIEDARFVNEGDKPVLQRFIENIKKNAIGVGTVVTVPSASTTPTGLEDALNGLKLQTDCNECKNSLNSGDVGVCTDHGKAKDIWHPGCFRCSTCHQLLVDMIYFYNDGKYYCGRHYADIHYPRCAGCDELIFAHEYTYAEEKSWHFDHFACYKCDLKLGGHRYMAVDEQPYCLPCYMEHYAKKCESCESKIAPDEKRLHYKEYHWHARQSCFQCQNCHKSLIDQKFLLKNLKVFCSGNCRDEFFKC